MTFSIVARSADGQAYGVAVASKFLAVGAVVPAAEAEVGALATQAHANLGYRPQGIALLRTGVTAAGTVAGLVAADPGRAQRQLGVVGAGGDGATYTGDACPDWAGGVAGDGWAIQGNLLTGPQVIDAMRDAWLDLSGDFAARLLGALRAGDLAGGDRRGRQSAALLVVAKGGGYGGGSDVLVDLRVDDHRDPVAELGRLLDIHTMLFGRSDPADLLDLDGDLAEEVAGLLTAAGYPPGVGDLDTALAAWAGVENLEERLAPGRIDPVVLAHLRTLRHNRRIEDRRRAHLVGSIPASDAAAAMALAVEHLGGDLDFLPDGETGSRRNWIIGMIESLRDHPALELVRDGDWSDYDDTPRFRVKRGQRLDELDLGIVAAAREALPVHARLAGGAGFQVGIPGDVDLAMFVFGPTGPVRHLRPFTEALAATMRQIHDLIGGDALFQIEIPVELVLMARAPRPARAMLASLLARRVARLVSTAPEGARFGVHLCLGDMNHRALGRLRDAGPLVQLANALVARWPAGRPLVYVHGPLAAADHPPVDDAAFYRPLRGLRLRGARFIAGYAHEDQDLATQRRIRQHVEDALGRRADVSTSCGLGRRDRAAAVAALKRIKALLT